MKRTMVAAALGLMLSAASSCVVLQPDNGAVQDRAAPVSFSGYALLPDQLVDLESQNSAGTFELFASTHAGHDALVLNDGTRLYAWHVSAVVPNWQGSGCDSAAQVRAMGTVRTLRTPLFTLDENGSSCVSQALNAGTPFARATEQCAAQVNSTLQLHAGAAPIRRDVEITTQAEADALGCATTIDGNLTVRPATAIVSIPRIRQVTGNVLIEVEDTGPRSVAGQADLPALQTIGGRLQFHQLDGAPYVQVNMGLPALTSLPGDMEVNLTSFNSSPTGLANLRSMGGNLTITATGDFYGIGLLEALQTVAGDVSLSTRGGGTSGGLLIGLQTITGNLSISQLNMIGTTVLGALTSVGGDMSLTGSAWFISAFGSLNSVGGTLSIEHAPVERFRDIHVDAALGSRSLSLFMGSLELTDTPFKTVPFHEGATVASTGHISIIDNPDLCPTSVDDFVARQLVLPWAIHISNNTGSCSP